MDRSARGLLQARWEDTAMQRKMAAYAVAASLILTLGVLAAHTLTAHTRPAHAAGHADRVTACGVERWRVTSWPCAGPGWHHWHRHPRARRFLRQLQAQ